MYEQDFKVKRGETFSKDITFKSDGEIYNLDGYIAKSQIRPSLESDTLIEEIQCTIQPENGIVHLELSSQQTLEMPAGIYYYDLCLNKDGVNTYYLEGKFIVTKYITEPLNV